MSDSSIEAIEAEVRRYVSMLVRGGYDALEEIVPSTVDYFTDTFDQELVGEIAERALSRELERLRGAQRSWAAITDYDRLSAAFDNLGGKGIVARENFACCQNCGMAEIGAELEQEEEQTGRSVRGFTFFHIQDTERAVEDGELYLSFGGAEDTEESALSTAADVVEELTRQGLETSWDGTWQKRIHVKMLWQRRIDV